MDTSLSNASLPPAKYILFNNFKLNKNQQQKTERLNFT